MKSLKESKAQTDLELNNTKANLQEEISLLTANVHDLTLSLTSEKEKI